MKTELRGINLHFHENAADYRAGDISFLIEGSQELPCLFELKNGYTAVHAAVEATLYVRDNLNSRTRAFFYGPETGPREINLNDKETLKNPLAEMPDEGKFLKPALEAMMEQYTSHGPGRPLHLVVVSSGQSDDKFSELYKTLLDMLQKPGGQVLLDVLVMPRVRNGMLPYQRMAHVCGIAASKMISGGKDTDPAKPAPNLLLGHDLETMQSALTSAINKRISPENPEEFMLNKLCEFMQSGTQGRVVCRRPASFRKQEQPKQP